MKLKFYLFVFFSLSFVYNHTQNCEDLKAWTTILKIEYPQLNNNRLRITRNLTENLAANLYSDKYYKPYSGESFLKSSQKKKEKVWRKIQKCYIKPEFKNDVYFNWVFQNIIYSYHLTPENNPFINKIENLNKLREELKITTDRITKNNATYDELQSYREAIKIKFNILFPSEIEKLKTVIENNESLAADVKMNQLLEKLIALNDSKNTLQTLYNFKDINQSLIQKLSQKNLTKMNAQIESKTKAVLANLLNNEKTVFNSTSTNTIRLINQKINSFNTDYNRYKNYQSVKDFYQILKLRKTSIVSDTYQNINSAISNSKKVKELNNISTLFLSDTDDSNLTIKNLKKEITDKQNAIISKEKAAKQIAQLKLQKAKQKFINEEDQRQKLIATHKKRVENLRKKLRIQHGVNLPKFEELHLILQYYLRLMNDDKKYKNADAEAFIKQVEKTGYMRKSDRNISDYEKFQARGGFEIRAFGTLGKTWASVQLIMPNPSKELVEMYSKELMSEFRHIDSTVMTPSVYPKPSDYYIVSGGTKYKLYVDKYKNLVAEAIENRELAFAILADKVQYNTWRVNSLKSATDVIIKKGQKVSLFADGKVKVGDFIGSVTPEGKKGYAIYSIEKTLNHGCLMARIGKGKWMYVGYTKKFIAETSGKLQLRVNDKFPDNNNGHFDVTYSLD